MGVSTAVKTAEKAGVVKAWVEPKIKRVFFY